MYETGRVQMKSLYLHGSEPLNVYLDGPALCVSQIGQSLRRYPFSRLSRVVVSGQVSWSTNALLQCADHGIWVSFMDANGVPKARMTGRTTKKTSLSQLWSDFLDRPDWEDLYKIWSESTNRRALRLCAWRLGWSPKIHISEIGEIIAHAIPSCIDEKIVEKFNDRLSGLTGIRAHEILDLTSINTYDFAGEQLLADIKDSIRWGIYPEVVKWFEKYSKKQELASLDFESCVVAFFEQNLEVVDFHLRDFLLRFQRHLQELS